jgi:hypothetical protein
MVGAKTCNASRTTEPNWDHLARHLARRALRRRGPLPASEVHSLAGLAVAEALARYDPDQATCGRGLWADHCGWLILQTLVRNEKQRRREQPPTVSFTDISAQFARYDDDGGDGALQRMLAPRASARRDLEWVDQLSDEERLLTRLRFAGTTLEDIARRFGRSRHWVRWRLKQLQDHVARLIGDPSLLDGLPPATAPPDQARAVEAAP